MLVILFFITVLSFLFRTYGFFTNYPFWVDEFSTAVESQYLLKYGLGVFNNPHIYFEHHNIVTHFLTAFLFKMLGNQEWVARLPSLVFGSLIPALVYLLGKHFFNSKTGFIAALLTAFSYFEIVWSRQARSYVLLQFIILVSSYIYFKLLSEKEHQLKLLLYLSIFLFLGFITHSFFYLYLIALVLHLSISKWNDLLYLLRKPWFYFLLAIIIFVSNQIGLFYTVWIYFKNGGFGSNNLWYYHSFLWREYSLITFLAVIGLILLFKKNRTAFGFVTLYLLLHFIFIFFGFKPMVSRYLLPIFPFILLLAANTITQLPYLFFKNQKHILTAFTSLFLTGFIILNGDKFVNRPKSFYSVNHDFREIALIDYQEIYDLIKKEGSLSQKDTAIIETWPARTYWYLGIEYKPTYIFKWKGNLPYLKDQDGEKLVPKNNGVKLIENASDLRRTIARHSKGYLLIDDSTLPKDVLDFAEKNLKKELYLDHYTLDDNPYSLWPATLYSWGIN